MMIATTVLELVRPRVTAEEETHKAVKKRCASLSASAGNTTEFASENQGRTTAVIFAFCHSLLFLLLFLFLCVGARAEEKPQNDLAPKLSPSTYQPTNGRDPFQKVGAISPKQQTSNVLVSLPRLEVQGILYHPKTPSAIVNDTLLELNKPANIKAGAGTVEVVAIEITRDKVVIDVGGGQTKELWLDETTKNRDGK